MRPARDRRSLAIVDGDELDLARLRIAPHRRIGLHRQLDPVLTEIDRRLGDVAVRHLGDAKPVFLDESVEHEFGKPRRNRIARRGRLGARERHELGQCGDAETRRHSYGYLHLGDPRDRREIGFGIEGHVFVQVA